MPALIPLHNTLGALFIGTILSSMIYGVTWLQVYSYYNGHCSRDRWPLKSFVAFLMLVDSANVIFIIYTTYDISVTNFGDYLSALFITWGQPATALTTIVLEVSVQHFYAYRIYRLSGGSRYLPAAISVVSMAEFGIGIVFCTKLLIHLHEPGNRFQDFSVATLSCKVLCDVLITVGMVYTLLSNRTQVRRTNSVLNLLAIYAINCGTLNLVFAISCVTLLAKYRKTLVYVPSFFIMTRLYFCAFMAILNSRDNLREMLDRSECVVATLTQFKAHTGRGTIVPCSAQDTIETSTHTAVPKGLPPLPDASFSDSVLAFDRETYPLHPVAGDLTV
ncbi:hypothetical protein BJY52DRAFT_864935 [Lactarius psammicola]|nr:hypothetical protein BJY52DRAFT_864935 [Lactarius psammicola]